MENQHGVRATLARGALGGIAVSLVLWSGAGAARAQLAPAAAVETLAAGGQLSTKFVIDDHNPEASVPSARERDANPMEYGYLLQDLLDRAERARKEGDHQAVARYYRAVVKAVPERAKGWSKLCEVYETLGDRERAVRACKFALARPGVELGDYVRYVHLLVDQPGELTLADRTDADQVLDHLAKQPSLALVGNQLRCDVGVKTKNVPMLEACTAALAKLAPNDPRTVVFMWSLAVQKGHRKEAEALLERTRKLGVVMEDNIERMDTLTASIGGKVRPTWPMLLFVGTVLMLGALGTLIIRAIARRRSLP